MDKIKSYHSYIKRLISEYGQYTASPSGASEVELIFDTEHDHY